MKNEDSKKKKKPLKDRIKDTAEQGKKKAKELWRACKDHKEVALFLVGAICKVSYEGYKVHNRRTDRKERRKEKENWRYDRSTGQWYELKRPMKTREKEEYDRRLKAARMHETNETVYIILKDMNLLKE